MLRILSDLGELPHASRLDVALFEMLRHFLCCKMIQTEITIPHCRNSFDPWNNLSYRSDPRFNAREFVILRFRPSITLRMRHVCTMS